MQPEAPQALRRRLDQNEQLIQIARHEIDRWKGLIPAAHLFLLADAEGVALYLHCPSKMDKPLREAGLQEGVHFSLDRLGINGISMAMERQTIVAVRGPEHDVEVLKDMNCICIPIRSKDGIAGYLDLSFSRQHDIEFAIPILLRIVARIETRLNNEVTDRSRERLYEAFDRFGLSPREKEAAYGWLRNYSALRIADEMGISEGTVRNLIKKVYAKTKQNDRGQFIQTFMQWL